MPAYSSSRSASGAPALSGVGWLALWAAGLAALYMLVGRKISWPWSGRQRGGQGGRWVYDRSLGGKMVSQSRGAACQPGGGARWHGGVVR